MKEYFSHDYHTRTDEKIIKLMLAMKWEGYGIYWGLLEMMYAGDGSIPSDYSLLAYEMRTQCERIKAVCEDFDLFYFRNERIFSKSVDRRLGERAKRSSLARISAMERWGKDANAMRTHNKLHANAMLVKERKGKERKEEERKEESNTFTRFWAAYPYKTGKKIAIRAWEAANPPLERCLAAIAWQKKSPQWTKENGKYIPMPTTWLNQGRWDDEPLTAQNSMSGAAPIPGKYEEGAIA